MSYFSSLPEITLFDVAIIVQRTDESFAHALSLFSLSYVVGIRKCEDLRGYDGALS